jgi:catechol 2,3-dioxygenase-like lactoylglutathione lyase family enzyme
MTKPTGAHCMETVQTPRGVDHIGLTVPDMQAASDFLARAFGAVTVYDVQSPDDEPMAGAETEQQLGLPDGAKIVHMRLMRIGDGPSIELFQFADTRQKDAPDLNDYGLQHFALYVDDIEAMANAFEEEGGKLLSPPHGLAGVEDGQGNAGVYGRAPWGVLIELISYPDGINYPDGAPISRWTPPASGATK